MRKIMATLSVLVTAIVGVTAPTAQASADTVSTTTTQNCNYYMTGEIVSAAYVRVGGSGYAEGAIQLCRNGDSYWAYMVLYSPEVSGYWARAYLHRYHNGTVTAISCDSSGGNLHIAPGQTLCWTGRLTSLSASDTFQAIGGDYAGTYPNYTSEYAWGSTALTR